MRNSEKTIRAYLSLSPKAQLAFLRDFNQNLDTELSDFFLCIALDKGQENALRKEAINVIGLFKGNDNDSAIKKALLHLIKSNDSDIMVHAINALAFMRIDESDILFVEHFTRHSNDHQVQRAALTFIASYNAPTTESAMTPRC